MPCAPAAHTARRPTNTTRSSVTTSGVTNPPEQGGCARPGAHDALAEARESERQREVDGHHDEGPDHGHPAHLPARSGTRAGPGGHDSLAPSGHHRSGPDLSVPLHRAPWHPPGRSVSGRPARALPARGALGRLLPPRGAALSQAMLGQINPTTVRRGVVALPSRRADCGATAAEVGAQTAGDLLRQGRVLAPPASTVDDQVALLAGHTTSTRLPISITWSLQIMSMAATETRAHPCDAGQGGIDSEPWMA